jgi:membrane protein implicated in regulation of membrane protease activity
MDERVGESAQVTLRIPSGGMGQVMVKGETYPARASDSTSEFTTGSVVWIDEVQGRMCYVSSGRP